MATTVAQHSMTFEAIGTHWGIDIIQPIHQVRLTALEYSITERIARFDAVYSRFREDSLVTRISRSSGTYEFPADAQPLFDMYQRMYKFTDGKVTPLVGNLLTEAGYDASYTLRPKSTLHPVARWEEVISYSYPTLNVHEPIMLDFGAAGKGYLVDIIGELLQSEHIHSYVIDAGGDILRKSLANDTIRVGLGNPADTEQAIGVALLGNGSICGSAGNRRQWAGLHHIMDPDKAEPVRDIIATWATANSALVADGMATALFFTDPLLLQTAFDFEYCVIYRDHSYAKSPRFAAELFTDGDA